MKQLTAGPILALWLTLVSAGILLVIVLGAADPGSEEVWRDAVRVTARVSFLCFFPVLIARPIDTLRRGDLSRWLMRNRRYIGLGFGGAHIVHLAAILGLLFIGFGGDTAKLGGWPSIGPGAAIYLVLFAMMLTSTHASIRRLGARNWKRLHRLGLWLLVLAFVKGFFLAQGSPSATYAVFQALLLAGLALRWLTWRHEKARLSPS